MLAIAGERQFVPAFETDLVYSVRHDSCASEHGWQRPLEWPASASELGIRAGLVAVEFDVASDGVPANPCVLESAPPGVFDESVLRWLSSRRFCPQMQDGRPLPSTRRKLLLRFVRDEERT